MSLEFPTSSDLWISKWLLELHLTFGITCLLEFHESLVHTWLLDFHLFVFTMIATIHHEFDLIIWWDLTCHYLWWLGLIVTNEMDFFQWWHGCHLYLHSSSSFNNWCPYPSKGLWSNGVFRVLWSSRFKCVFHSFHASFVCSLFSIFLMCALHDFFGILAYEIICPYLKRYSLVSQSETRPIQKAISLLLACWWSFYMELEHTYYWTCQL